MVPVLAELVTTIEVGCVVPVCIDVVGTVSVKADVGPVWLLVDVSEILRELVGADEGPVKLVLVIFVD